MSQYYDSFGNNLIENNVIDKENEENITYKEQIDYKMLNNSNKIYNFNWLNLPNELIWKFEHTTKDHLYLIIVFTLLVFYVIYKISLSFNFVISLIITCIIAYVYFTRIFQKEQKELKKENKKLSDMNIFKYKYLFLDIKIINIYHTLRYIKKYNESAFEDSLSEMNDFMKTCFEIKKKYTNYNNKDQIASEIYYQKITNSILYLKRSLNSLMSIVIDIPVNLQINDIPMPKYLDTSVKHLFKIANEKLMEIIKLYNLRWKNSKNINRNSHYIDINSPEPNPLNSYDYMSNYNLY